MNLPSHLRKTLTANGLCRTYTSKPPPLERSGLLPPRLNYKAIAERPDLVAANAAKRNVKLLSNAVHEVGDLYKRQKHLQSTYNTQVHLQSTLGDKIRASREPDEKKAIVEEAKTIKRHLATIDAELATLKDQLLSLAVAIPNDTHPDAPVGAESAASTISIHGPAGTAADSKRDHVSVGRALDLLDLESGAVTSGSSWYYLRNEGALLELALTNYALSIALAHGFTFVTTPDVVRADMAHRCGFQPRDQDAAQIYHLADTSPQLVLAGTAEIPLAGMFANKTFDETELPLKVVGLGRAFRAEAGARGADTRGLYRVHQFSKLELFAVTAEDKSEEMMEHLRQIQTEIFEGLNIPIRVLDMPTEELGASAYRKYDMESWMPGRGSWGEISSTSNCTDYQARRMHIRYRRAAPTEAAGLPFAHTLNGTAAAIPRLIVALLENGARFDESGAVTGLNLPRVLQRFWIGNNSRSIIHWV